MHPLSTSNHNRVPVFLCLVELYCILFLHQTTTDFFLFFLLHLLYCILFLHQTTTLEICVGQKHRLYCILFLHQTTTDPANVGWAEMLYCILFLHQTTTVMCTHICGICCIASSFYIKPQLQQRVISFVYSCIASSFYIKPQLRRRPSHRHQVVLHPLSTSNHNRRMPPSSLM